MSNSDTQVIPSQNIQDTAYAKDDCVIVMRGIPGSGKSTLVKRLVEACPTARVVSADHFFMQDGVYVFDPSKLSQAHAACRRAFLHQMVREPFNRGVVIVDNTNTHAWEIELYVGVALAYDVPVRILRLDVSAEVAAMRNIHGVPPGVVRAMAERMNESLPRHQAAIERAAEPWVEQFCAARAAKAASSKAQTDEEQTEAYLAKKKRYSNGGW